MPRDLCSRERAPTTPACSPKTRPWPLPSSSSSSQIALLSCWGGTHGSHPDLSGVFELQDTARPRDSDPGRLQGHQLLALVPTGWVASPAGMRPPPPAAPGGIGAHPGRVPCPTLSPFPARPQGTSQRGEIGALAPPAHRPPPKKPRSGGCHPSSNPLTAAEPPLPDGAGAAPHRREPEPSAGRASQRSLLKPPQQPRALHPEAPHYRTGSQLVPRSVWDRRYWLGRWLRTPFPPQLGRREGLGAGRQPGAGCIPSDCTKLTQDSGVG